MKKILTETKRKYVDTGDRAGSKHDSCREQARITWKPKNVPVWKTIPERRDASMLKRKTEEIKNRKNNDIWRRIQGNKRW